VSPLCPECGAELKIADGYELERAKPGPSGRNWKRLALLALAVALAVGACVIVELMK